MSVIANNTILSNLALVNRLDLLKSVSEIIYLTLDVYKEIENGILCGHSYQMRTRTEIERKKWLFVTVLDDSENIILSKLPDKLHSGEASCLAVSKNRRWTFLTDDGTARNCANEIGVVISGTIGILLASVDIKLITVDEGDDYLQTMIKNRYRSPIKHLWDAF
jgi:predicted nucleic acid-binding protein